MNVLVHYTTLKSIFDSYSDESGIISDSNMKDEIDAIYDSWLLTQSKIFLVISYSDVSLSQHYTCLTVYIDEGEYRYNKMEKIDSNLLLKDTALLNRNTYTRGLFYKVLTTREIDKFYHKDVDNIYSKIRLKYFQWDEIIKDLSLLHKEMIDILYDEVTIFAYAEDYYEENSLTRNVQLKKYYSALKTIGFIRKPGKKYNVDRIKGDIGELLMIYFVSKFFTGNRENTYVYPKLIHKTHKNMPVFGNDGTIYDVDENTIYFMESKFHNSFGRAIKSALTSLRNHNEEDDETNFDSLKTKLFKNIDSFKSGEIVDIDNDVTIKLVLFITTSKVHEEEDIKRKVLSTFKNENLPSDYEVILYVFPILDEEKFVELFLEHSRKVWDDYEANRQTR